MLVVAMHYIAAAWLLELSSNWSLHLKLKQ